MDFKKVISAPLHFSIGIIVYFVAFFFSLILIFNPSSASKNFNNRGKIG